MAQSCSDYRSSSWGLYYGRCDANLSNLAKGLIEDDANDACSMWCRDKSCNYISVDFNDNLSCVNDSVRTKVPCVGSKDECVKSSPGLSTQRAR